MALSNRRQRPQYMTENRGHGTLGGRFVDMGNHRSSCMGRVYKLLGFLVVLMATVALVGVSAPSLQPKKALLN